MDRGAEGKVTDADTSFEYGAEGRAESKVQDSFGRRMSDFSELLTEARNLLSENMDRLSTLELVRLIHVADGDVIAAVEREAANTARVVDAVVERFERGGRLFYVGAGTSGRLGVLDASECPPTFNVSADKVQAIVAGGDAALRSSVEEAEDDPAQGAAELKARGLSEADSVVGIAASGRTPYVLGAVTYAKGVGALSVGLSCVPGSELAGAAAMAITPAVGPEVLTGSTRMKAGTATKLILNALSTAVMVRCGYVYGNLMVNVQPANAKLLDRARRVVVAATSVAYERAVVLLEEAGSVKTAIVMEKLGVDRTRAEACLQASGGRLREAIEAAAGTRLSVQEPE